MPITAYIICDCFTEFDLGKTLKGETISDVELPAWAKSPEDFVRKHREALVSTGGHWWVLVGTGGYWG